MPITKEFQELEKTNQDLKATIDQMNEEQKTALENQQVLLDEQIIKNKDLEEENSNLKISLEKQNTALLIFQNLYLTKDA